MQVLRLLAAPALVLLSATAALAGLTDGETLTFTGTTSDWYDVANWDLGRLPKAGDDVILDSGRAVVIDPAHAPAADPDPASSGSATFSSARAPRSRPSPACA